MRINNQFVNERAKPIARWQMAKKGAFTPKDLENMFRRWLDSYVEGAAEANGLYYNFAARMISYCRYHNEIVRDGTQWRWIAAPRKQPPAA